MERKNVFVTSMYFFIPLNNQKVTKHYRETKERKYKEMRVPLGVRHPYCRCAYSEGIKEEKSFFYYTHHSKWVKIEIVPYIINYQPNPNVEEKDYEYYFVINANIDKWVHSKEKSCDEKYDKRLCTEKDIVCLKKAFYDNLLHQICCGTIDSKTIKDWARKKIEKIEGVPERDIVFDYSLVNITCEAIDTSNLQQLEDNFAAKYFEFPHQKMENNIDGNYKQFIYGVLFGNDDYIRVPEQKINRVIDKSYTNNDTEMTYARRRSIVFLKTHSPFERYPPFPKPHYHLEDNLDNVQNIYDICSALYIETQMRKLRNPNEKKSLGDIKASLSTIVGHLYSYIFYMRLADEKAQYIYKGLGLIIEYKNMKQLAELRAESDHIRITQNTNNIIKWLTAAMFLLSLIQIYPLFIKLKVECSIKTLLGFFYLIHNLQ